MMIRQKQGMLLLAVLLVLVVSAVPAMAQGGDSSAISDDEVNAVADKLYCPVCENIPLEDCGTQACVQWREEIRDLLAAGMSEEEVIDDFVRRFGDRVVGTPQDPTLRAISLVTPWVIAGLMILAGGYTLVRWRFGRQGDDAEPPAADIEPETPEHPDDAYLAQLENDLRG